MTARNTWLPICWMACGLIVASIGVQAQTVEDVFPLEPEDEARVGPRPTLRIGVDGTEIHKMMFRIVMSPDDFETEWPVYDQKEDRNGWAFAMLGGESGALFRVPRPLADGLYAWRAEVWNGVDWIEGETVFRLWVDGVRPADVDPPRMTRTEEGAVRIDWNPVTLDEEGRPEYVRSYHVYRYERRSLFFSIRAFEIGVTEDTFFVDGSPKAKDSSLVFYKVTAEDMAGNHDFKWHSPASGEGAYKIDRAEARRRALESARRKD